MKKMLAEKEGFEPSVRCRTHDFQSCTFGLSVTSPLGANLQRRELYKQSAHFESGKFNEPAKKSQAKTSAADKSTA
jgi:hypothetical protein